MYRSNISGPMTVLALRHRRWVLLALLCLMHLVILQGPESLVGRILFVADMGLAMLWQPFIRSEHSLSIPGTLFIIVLAVVAAFWLSWFVLIIWIMLCASMIGGKVPVFPSRWTRLFYLLALGYLVAVLLVCALPGAIYRATLPEPIANMVLYVLPLLFVPMALFPAEQEVEKGVEVVDFIYSIFLFLMLAVLLFGSISFMLLFDLGYITAIFYVLLGLGVMLGILGWAWNPRAGTAGVGGLLTRHVLSIGLPMEQWLHTLADLAVRSDDPEVFLADACTDMVNRLPWVRGVDWRSGSGQGVCGIQDGRRSEFSHGTLTLGIVTSHSLSPSLVWHFDLLAQLLSEFYGARIYARQLNHLSYVQAIHETGSRLTHDVKNLLQSLNALIAAAATEQEQPSAELLALIRRQLPLISQRLALTLGKLQGAAAMEGERVTARLWLDRLCSHYAGLDISARLDASTAELSLPRELFDSIAENLLQNLIDKRHAEPDLRVQVLLEAVAGEVALDIVDSGRAIEEKLARKLLREPVASENGLGIGLYNAARQANLSGYRFGLVENQPGAVRFRLAPAPP